MRRRRRGVHAEPSLNSPAINEGQPTMHNPTHPTASTNPDGLSQLDISQAVLEDEENPSALRARTPQERRAQLHAERGGGWGAACGNVLRGITRSPVKLIGGAAVLGLAVALAVARRPGRA
jgi:hypothetical protein